MRKLTFTALLAPALLLLSCKNADTPCIDPDKANPDQVCTMQYEPVCGCDGKTYGNACEAERAGVTAYKPGACAEKN